MSGSSSTSRGPEEMISLLDEKTLSDLESDLDKAEADRRFPPSPWLNVAAHCMRSIRPSNLTTTAIRTSFFLVPSFLQPLITKERSKPDKLYPTSYLDGMRGLAAFGVFLCHFTYTCFVITFGYGFGEPGQNNSFWQLPFVRLIYSGPPMVCVFFVISGYALSLKPLKQMRSGSWEQLLGTMSSSIFRRGLRLFIPTITSTFMIFVMLRLGLYEFNRAFANDPNLLHNVREYHPERLPTFGDQFKDWIWQMFNFIQIFSWLPFAGSTSYDVHLWTIPVEFRSSMMLFVTLIGLSRLRSSLRMIILFLVFLYTFRNDRWDLMLFYSGTMIAELDLIRQTKPSPTAASPTLLPFASLTSLHIPSPRITRNSTFVRTFWIFLFILSLYLMSQPDEGFAETPGWVWLTTLIPSWFSEKYRFWQCIGSMLLVLSVSRSPLLQKPFNTRCVQYLGKISYAIYVMHGPVMHTIGYTIERIAWSFTGIETPGQYRTGFVFGSIFIIPIVIWASDVFWRAIDAPSVKFARWLESKVTVKEETNKESR